MRNPRGYFLSGLFLIAFLLFVLGPVQGNPRVSEKGTYAYSMNSPPGQTVIAVIETQTFQIAVEPAVCTQIDRGVSVPLKILNVPVTMIDNFYTSPACMNNSIVSPLGDWHASQTNVINYSESLRHQRVEKWIKILSYEKIKNFNLSICSWTKNNSY